MQNDRDPTAGSTAAGKPPSSLLEAGKKEGFEKSTKTVPKASHDDVSDYSEDWPDDSP